MAFSLGSEWKWLAGGLVAYNLRTQYKAGKDAEAAEKAMRQAEVAAEKKRNKARIDNLLQRYHSQQNLMALTGYKSKRRVSRKGGRSAIR